MIDYKRDSVQEPAIQFLVGSYQRYKIWFLFLEHQISMAQPIIPLCDYHRR